MPSAIETAVLVLALALRPALGLAMLSAHLIFLRWTTQNHMGLPANRNKLLSSVKRPKGQRARGEKCLLCKGICIDPRQLPCRHIYCASCLKELFVDRNYSSCLYCQKTLFMAPTTRLEAILGYTSRVLLTAHMINILHAIVLLLEGALFGSNCDCGKFRLLEVCSKLIAGLSIWRVMRNWDAEEDPTLAMIIDSFKFVGGVVSSILNLLLLEAAVQEMRARRSF